MVFPHDAMWSVLKIRRSLLLGVLLIGRISANAAELLPAERSLPEAIDFYLHRSSIYS